MEVPTVEACHGPMQKYDDSKRQEVQANTTATRPHPFLHQIGIENGERQRRHCRHDGDVDPELDDVEAVRRTEQGHSQHDHERERLDGGLQSDRHWLSHVMRCVAITKRLSVLIAVGLCWQLKVCCRSHTSVSYAAASSDCGIVNRRATGGHIPKIIDTESVLIRFFAGLLAYLVGISVVISIGIIGLMALQSSNERTSSAPTVSVALHKESLAKPVKQPI